MGLGGVGLQSSIGRSSLLAACFGFHHEVLYPLGLLPEIGDKLGKKELKEKCRTKAGGYKHVSGKVRSWGPAGDRVIVLPAWHIHQNQDEKQRNRRTLPPAVSLQHLLLVTVITMNIMLSGEGKRCKGPRSLFTQQSVKGDLWFRGNELLSGTKVFLI